MPRISAFYGITIGLFYGDHAPPHFHASYGEFKGRVDIQALVFLDGSDLPRRASHLVIEWATIHQEELMRDWEKAQRGEAPDKIEPLT